MTDTVATPVLSPTEINYLKQYPHTVIRHLLFQPIVEHGRARVLGAPSVDPDSGGIYQFRYNNATGTPTNAEEGEVILIGTTPGARDIGVLRMRKNITDTNLVSVNEVSQGEVPIADGAYITWLRQRKIMQRRIRRVPTDDTGTDYTEYLDYDIPYAGQNQDNTPPVGNITGGNDARPYKVVGRLDAGQSYRTVVLYYGNSINFRLQNIDAQWFLDPGCSFSPGYSATDATVHIRVPLGCVRVKLAVSNEENLGDGFRYINLYTLPENSADDENVINRFQVTSDTSSEGRAMDFTIFDFAMPNGVLPKGTEVVYWEEHVDFDGNPMPDAYREAFLGWTVQDSVPLRLYYPVYKIKVEGPAGILNRIGGFPQTWYDPRNEDEPTASADKFVEIPRNYPDYTIYKIIDTQTNAFELMNIFASDIIVPIEGLTTSEGSVWSQVNGVVQRYFGTALCDTIGSLFLTRYYSYFSQADRDGVDLVINIDKSHMKDNQPLEIVEDQHNKVAQLDIYGSNFDIIVASGGDLVDFSHVWRVNAPGITQSDGISYESYVSVFLKSSQAGLQELKDLAGHHYARLNNKLSDITLPLKGNLDIVEVAWGRPISITYTDDNSRGIEFVDKLFLIKNISITHNFEKGQPPKEITWTLEAVTFGRPGEEVRVKQRAVVQPYPDAFPENPTKISAFASNRYIHNTNNFDAVSPDWTSIDLTGILPAGSIFGFETDFYSPLYTGIGSEVNGWISFATTSGSARIYRVTDIFGSIAVTLQYTSATLKHGSSQFTIRSSRNFAGWVVAGFCDGSRAHVLYTVDGINWVENLFGSSGNISSLREIHLSPHTPGLCFVTFKLSTVAPILMWKSVDYGDTFPVQAPNTTTVSPGVLVSPYTSNDSELYYFATNPGSGDVELIDNLTFVNTYFNGGHHEGRDPYAFAISDLDDNAMCISGFRTGTSTAESGVSFDKGATWLKVNSGGASPYVKVRISSRNKYISFWFGANKIGVCDGLSDIVDKSGSGPTALPAGFYVNIAAG